MHVVKFSIVYVNGPKTYVNYVLWVGLILGRKDVHFKDCYRESHGSLRCTLDQVRPLHCLTSIGRLGL